MKKFFTKWIIIGVLIRLLIIPFTCHPDIRAIDFGSFLVSQKGMIFGFYDYLSSLGADNPLLKIYGADLFIYPPLAYLVPGFFMFLLGPLYNFSFHNIFLLDAASAFSTFDLFRHLFLLKLPYLFFDLLAGYLLFSIFKGEKGEKAFKLWMFNPLTLYATFAMGQIDIFPTLAVIASIYFGLKKKNILAIIMLGVGGAFKLTPLLFLPLFVLILENDFLKRLKLLFVGGISYGLLVLPYLLLSPMYRQSALLAGQTDKMFYMSLPVSGGEGISIFAIGYFLLLILSSRKSLKLDYLWKMGLGLLLLFFSVTHYHPQWFLWLTPFLIWLLVEFKKQYVFQVFLLFSCFLGVLIFFEPSLHLGLFSPLFPNLSELKQIKSLPFMEISFVKILIRSLFAALSISVFSSLLLGKERNG
ncbi:DUF2029 domain-containing protein [Patescibacteria group bacterium]|nr:DUF2029 domain-containing protein [Patescibacteria group bacterium]